MNRFLQHRLLLTILAAGTLGGCAQIAPLLERNPSSNHPKVESRPEPRAESRPRAEARSEASSGREQVALREGIRLYNEGDFNGAIKRLTLGQGQHTIRIVNPNFAEHVMTVNAGATESATIEHDFTAQAEGGR